MDIFETSDSTVEDKNLVILQSLLCLLREKNLLTRADIEQLCATVQARAADPTPGSMPCRNAVAAAEAANEMAQIGNYIGHRYGGKHRRVQ